MICNIPSTFEMSYIPTDEMLQTIRNCLIAEIGRFTPSIAFLESKRVPIAFIEGEIVYSPKGKYQLMLERAVEIILNDYKEKYKPYIK